MSDPRKPKTLFDHLNEIISVQDPDYYDNLDESSRRTWSNFMIGRFLSMNYDYVELIADVLVVSQTLEPNIFYKLLIGVVPKRKVFLRYIKGVHDEKIDNEIIQLLMIEYACSTNTAIDYYNILMNVTGGKEYIQYLKGKYGKHIEDKSTKKKNTKHSK